MAYTTINKSSDYFNTKLYTGTGSFPQSISGVGFQPDWVWIKRRNIAASHVLSDIIRGTTKTLYTDSTSAELTSNTYGWVSAFGSDGFSVNQSGSNGENVNASGSTYASWNWKANGAGSANTDGTISSTVSVNTTAGFSIVKWVGTGSNATIGHGLGVKPAMIITKPTSAVGSWYTYHKSLDATDFIKLNSTDATADNATIWNDTEPTTSVFTTGTAFDSGRTFIAYCFADVTGYSKFGSYTGNGSSSSGTFIYTGFKPAWVLVKRTNASGNNWQMHDIKRTQYAQPINHRIAPNVDLVEQTGDTLGFDFVSNGFRPNNNNADYNGSGSTYIYMAFGQSIVGTNNIPATAR